MIEFILIVVAAVAFALFEVLRRRSHANFKQKKAVVTAQSGYDPNDWYDDDITKDVSVTYVRPSYRRVYQADNAVPEGVDLNTKGIVTINGHKFLGIVNELNHQARWVDLADAKTIDYDDLYGQGITWAEVMAQTK
ncbi:hypothetical protein [Weissella cibaria]|uniref:hypothetical protein n=1 Tax=Weissella cibaria TaxID=137591 RepID=UPI00189D6D6F|nr:hypothetical protein [Weissella cibaria]